MERFRFHRSLFLFLLIPAIFFLALINPFKSLAATFSLSGVAYYDTNLNGVKDTSENPYNNATVTLSSGQTTTTTSTGNYSFANLPSGNYSVKLTLPLGNWKDTTSNPAVAAIGTTNATVNFGIAQPPDPTATPIPCAAPPQPTSLNPTGTIAAGTRAITWSAVSGITSYGFRVDDENSPWVNDCSLTQAAGDVCTNVNGTSYNYTFVAGHVYSIWVQSIAACGNWSTNATAVTVTAQAPAAGSGDYGVTSKYCPQGNTSGTFCGKTKCDNAGVDYIGLGYPKGNCTYHSWNCTGNSCGAQYSDHYWSPSCDLTNANIGDTPNGRCMPPKPTIVNCALNANNTGYVLTWPEVTHATYNVYTGTSTTNPVSVSTTSYATNSLTQTTFTVRSVGGGRENPTGRVSQTCPAVPTATPIPPKPTATFTPAPNQPTATPTVKPTATATPKPVPTATPKPVATATPIPSSGDYGVTSKYCPDGNTSGTFCGKTKCDNVGVDYIGLGYPKGNCTYHSWNCTGNSCGAQYSDHYWSPSCDLTNAQIGGTPNGRCMPPKPATVTCQLNSSSTGYNLSWAVVPHATYNVYAGTTKLTSSPVTAPTYSTTSLTQATFTIKSFGGGRENPTGRSVTCPPVPTATVRPTATSTPRPTATLTPRPTATPTIRPTNTPSPTPVPNSTILSLVVGIDGIGTTGDNASPNNSSGSNKNPLHPTRNVTVGIFNATNQLITSANGSIVYNSSTGKFAGTVSLGTNFTTGNYLVTVLSDAHLRRLLPGIQTITSARSNTLPQVNLVAGDLNKDNALTILDYNILLSCSIYSQDSNTLCKSNANFSTISDLDDNGTVDQFDYNLFVREYSVQNGDQNPN